MANDAALMQATSAGIGRDGSTYVLLRWEAVDDVTGYNLYRRVDGAPARESRPINGSSPIRPPSSARQLRAVVPERSPEWAALAAGFTAVSGGVLERVNPAARFEQGLTEDDLRLVRATSRANLAMAQAAGLAYTDRGVKANEHYLYELRGVLADGTKRRLAVDVPVSATSRCPTRRRASRPSPETAGCSSSGIATRTRPPSWCNAPPAPVARSSR